jgi:replicative DNA helicase
MKDKKKIKQHPLNKFTPVREALDQAFADFDGVRSGESSRTELSSSFDFMNNLFIGRENPRFSIVSVPVNAGGTRYFGASLTGDLAVRYDRKLACFSMQVSSSYYSTIMLTSRANVNHELMLSGKIPSELWPRLSTCAGQISEADIYINDTRIQSVKSIRKTVKKLMGESDIDLVVIDNLQRVSDEKKYEDSVRANQDICQSLLALSLELNISILLLSQFSEAYDPDIIKEPHDCESLEFHQNYGRLADAELCLIPTENDREESTFDLHVYRNRQGQTGTMKLMRIPGGVGFMERVILKSKSSSE